MQEIISQHLYWPITINAIQKEVTNHDTFQCTKRSNVKNAKLPAQEAGKIPLNFFCVDQIGPYVIQKKGKKNLNI